MWRLTRKAERAIGEVASSDGANGLKKLRRELLGLAEWNQFDLVRHVAMDDAA